MSVLVEFSMFPLDQGDSLSAHVSRLVALIRESGVDYRLTAMGTLIETEELDGALALIARCDRLLQDRGCHRIYAAIKIDRRDGPIGRLRGKIQSIEESIGQVEQ